MLNLRHAAGQVVGVDAQWNTRVEQQYYEVDSGDMILDTNDTSRTVGLYAQDEWRFHPQWLLNASLRYDKHSDFDAVTSPRAALIWQPTQRLSLKGIVGSSYRTPNAYERFYNDVGASQNANPTSSRRKYPASSLRPRIVSARAGGSV